MISNSQATVEGYEFDRSFRRSVSASCSWMHAKSFMRGRPSTCFWHSRILPAGAPSRASPGAAAGKGYAAGGDPAPRRQQPVNHRQYPPHEARTVQSEETRLRLEDAHQRVLVGRRRPTASACRRRRQTDRDSPISYQTVRTLAQWMVGDSRPVALKVEADAAPRFPRRHEPRVYCHRIGDERIEHAFPGEKPDAAIAVSYEVWGRLETEVSDNGVGKPDVTASQTNLGLAPVFQGVDETIRRTGRYRAPLQRHRHIVTHATLNPDR